MTFVSYSNLYDMESIAQFLSSLKENEKSVIVSIIANALTIYMLCFVGIGEFKTYPWYQQLIIPCSLSIAYAIVFYFLTIVLFGFFSLFKRSRNFCRFMIEDNSKWFICAFSLNNLSILIEIVSTLLDKSHELSITKIILGTVSVIIGLILLMIIMAICGPKDTPRN